MTEAHHARAHSVWAARMTVYVDDMYLYPLGQFGRMKMSHMIADKEDELHAMAATIGVARRWYQGDHYDVAMSARAKAVAAGAKEITLRQCSFMDYVRKSTGVLPPPEDAEWLRTQIRKSKS